MSDQNELWRCNLCHPYVEGVGMKSKVKHLKDVHKLKKGYWNIGNKRKPKSCCGHKGLKLKEGEADIKRREMQNEKFAIQFNDAYQVGMQVVYVDDFGVSKRDIISGQASILDDHTPVVWLVGRGCVKVDRVRPCT